MKKILALTSLIFLGFCVSCSDGDSSSTANDEKSSSLPTFEDSTTVFVYSYDKFISKNDVSILNDDTSKISISLELAKRTPAHINGEERKDNDDLPKEGNVVVLWEGPTTPPCYLRVKSATESDSVLTLDVSMATVGEALPAGEFNLSSKIFIDPSAINENSDEDIGPEAFYDKSTNTYYPIGISRAPTEENDEGFEYESLSDDTFDKLLENEGYIDFRKLVKENYQSWGGDARIRDINIQFTPGAFLIPMSIDDFLFTKGEWSDLFKGKDALKKAFEENAGANVASELKDNWSTRAYVRMDTIKYRATTDFHLYVKTDLLRPVQFTAVFYDKTELKISNLGAGIGGMTTLERKLTKCPTLRIWFNIAYVPVWVDFTLDLYFKGSFDGSAIFNYPLQFSRTTDDTIGISWDKASGFRNINNEHVNKTYNEPKDFNDFVAQSHLVFNANLSAGVYVRLAALLYGVGGPTIGVGGRFDVSGEVDVSNAFDEEGKRTGFDADGSFSIDFSIPLEIGGEVRLLGKTLFSRNMDVVDLKTWNIYEYPKEEEEKKE